MLCDSLRGREFRGEWVCVYVWLSPFAVLLELSQYCYKYITYIYFHLCWVLFAVRAFL